MATTLITRVRLKLRRIVRELAETPDERVFRQHVWPLIEPIEGWLDFKEAVWLFLAAGKLARGSNIMEIGSYKGRSTCCLGLGARLNNSRVFAVDSFDGGPGLPRAYSFPEFSQNVNRCGLCDAIEPIVGVSAEVSKTWKTPIHLLFIDGSHTYEDVLADFAGFFPHVVANGVVAFHDAYNPDWPDVLRAWDGTIKGQLTEIGRCKTLAYGLKAPSTW